MSTLPLKPNRNGLFKSFLANKYGHVSPERLLSGPGLEDLYLAIAAFNNKAVEPLNAAQIAGKALDGSCAVMQSRYRAVFCQFRWFSRGFSPDVKHFWRRFCRWWYYAKITVAD